MATRVRPLISSKITWVCGYPSRHQHQRVLSIHFREPLSTSQSGNMAFLLKIEDQYVHRDGRPSRIVFASNRRCSTLLKPSCRHAISQSRTFQPLWSEPVRRAALLNVRCGIFQQNQNGLTEYLLAEWLNSFTSASTLLLHLVTVL